MINWLTSLASANADRIGKFLGVPGRDVRGAIEQGKKMLPEIQSPEDGVAVFKRLGMSPQFLDNVYNRFGSHVGKIPGMNKRDIDKYYKDLRSQLESGSAPNVRQNTGRTEKAKPNLKKYPKV